MAVWTYWASRHIGADPGEPGGTLLQETGRDERLARLRVRHWRGVRPEVTTQLLRRRVTVRFGPWEEVVDEGAEAG